MTKITIERKTLEAAIDTLIQHVGFSPKAQGLCIELRAALAAQPAEPVAYIEHHKAGDNLVWDHPGGKHTPLYAAVPTPAAVPPGYALVPLEPTVEMRRAAAPWIKNYHMMRAGDKTNAIDDAYREMIAAAPSAGGA